VNGKGVVLDTNAVIMLLDDETASHFLDEILPGNVRCISVITQIELLGYPGITEEAEELVRSFLDDIPIVTIEDLIVENAIKIRRSKPGIKLPDAVIAATAVVLKAILVTNDTDLLKFDFPGLNTLNIAPDSGEGSANQSARSGEP
jgi:predicted nucleic acid-binding protein